MLETMSVKHVQVKVQKLTGFEALRGNLRRDVTQYFVRGKSILKA